MAAPENYVEKVDVFVAELFSAWNVSTTLIALALLVFLAYPLLTWTDPDVHPFLLARQASAAPVRQPGETAVYRSIDIPYGYPLRAGLAVKDPGAPKWSGGRNGDVRDVLRQAMRGPLKDDGSRAGPNGNILTVLGTQKVVEHSLDEFTRDVNAIGKYVQRANGQRLAICLPNSMELLASLFAAVFYGSYAVLIPYGLDDEKLRSLLSQVNPDILVAQAGVMQGELPLAASDNLRHVIWVTQAGSEHMDWSAAPPDTGLKVHTWRELVGQHRDVAASDLPPLDLKDAAPPFASFSDKNGQFELVEYTSENLVAGIAAVNAALARSHRLGPADLVLPLTPLTDSYALCVTFAALFSNASIALNSVSGADVSLTAAVVGVAPTVIVASTSTVDRFYRELSSSGAGLLGAITQYFRSQTLKAGNMPSTKPILPNMASLARLRLLMISYPAGSADAPKLPSTLFTGLRSLLGVRIAYALTTPKVFGAICQTNILDYRKSNGDAQFGPPLSSVEISLAGSEDDVATELPCGQIVVKGPAVVGGQTKLDVLGRIEHDHTLSLA